MKFFDDLRQTCTANLGIFDRLLRSIVAVALLVLVFTSVIDGWLIAIPILAAIYLILTGDIGFSPVYKLFNWSTAKRETEKKSTEV